MYLMKPTIHLKMAKFIFCVSYHNTFSFFLKAKFIRDFQVVTAEH